MENVFMKNNLGSLARRVAAPTAIILAAVILSSCGASGVTASKSNGQSGTATAATNYGAVDCGPTEPASELLDDLNETMFKTLALEMQLRPDNPKAIVGMEEMARHGYVEAQYLMGLLYRDGDFGVIRNLKTSHGWFLCAAQRRHDRASYEVGRNYSFEGRGAAVDKSEGFRWILVSAQAGYAPGQYVAAMMYLDGSGGVVDQQKHLYWLLKAAEGGEPMAVERIKKYREMGLI